MKVEKKRVVGVIGTVLILVTVLLVSDTGALSMESFRGIAILAAALLMLITEPIPPGIVAPLVLVLLPLLGVVTFDQALKSSMTTLFLFLMACYGISMVLLKSSIPERLAVFLLAKSHGRPLYVVGAFMLGTALISSVVSNVPCAVIMTGLAARVLHSMGEDMGKSPLGKAMMMSVPFGAVFGGMMTPAGSSLNVLSISLVEEATGQKVLFTEWMLLGIPLALILIFLSVPILTLLFKVKPVEEDTMEKVLREMHNHEKLSRYDRKALMILLVTFVLWVMTSWVPWLNVTMVSVLILTVFFLPGLDMLTWKEYSRECGWDTILICSAILSVGAALVETGVTTFLVTAISPYFTNTVLLVFLLIIALLVNWTHLLIPTASAIVVLYASSFAALSESYGYDPRMISFIVAAMASCVLLIPFDPVVMVSYTKGSYTMKELFTAGTVVSTICAILLALWVPIAFLFI
jgi:sodium-dependent dicarboxylate transporter 2/3/5